MSTLSKREPLHSVEFRARHHASRAFHKPQRDRPLQAQYPKPRCGMCGGKVHTRTDYRAPEEVREPYLRKAYGLARKSDWWLCAKCDTGPEVGMPRAA